jgi:hypothetical protein
MENSTRVCAGPVDVKTPYELEIIEILSDCIRKCSKSREQIADEMSHICGQEITLRMMNRYTATSEHMRFPAAFVPAFCEATRDDTLRRFIIGGEMRELLELGETAARMLKRNRQRVREIRTQEIPGDGVQSCAM